MWQFSTGVDVAGTRHGFINLLGRAVLTCAIDTQVAGPGHDAVYPANQQPQWEQQPYNRPIDTSNLNTRAIPDARRGQYEDNERAAYYQPGSDDQHYEDQDGDDVYQYDQDDENVQAQGDNDSQVNMAAYRAERAARDNNYIAVGDRDIYHAIRREQERDAGRTDTGNDQQYGAVDDEEDTQYLALDDVQDNAQYNAQDDVHYNGQYGGPQHTLDQGDYVSPAQDILPHFNHLEEQEEREDEQGYDDGDYYTVKLPGGQGWRDTNRVATRNGHDCTEQVTRPGLMETSHLISGTIGMVQPVGYRTRSQM